MRPSLLLACTLIVVGLAGCADGGGDGGPESSTSSSTPSTGSASSSITSTRTSTGTTTSSGQQANRAPTGAITATVNGTHVQFNLTGNDPDGDTLSWTLAFGDGNESEGTALPTAIDHTYGAAGNVTVLYTVTDGETQSNYTVSLNLTAGGGAATQDVDAEWEPATNPACADSGFPYDAIPGSFVEFEVAAGTWGLPFTASFDSGAAQDHVMFLDGAGEILLHVTVGLPDDATWVATGTVPDQSVTGVFFGCLGTPGEHVVYHAG